MNQKSKLLVLAIMPMLCLFFACGREMAAYEADNCYTGLEAIRRGIMDRTITRIVCYGDSITFGQKSGSMNKSSITYPDILAGRLKKINDGIVVFNEGHYGLPSDLGLKNLQNYVLSKRPHLAILMFGINDLRVSNDGECFKKNMGRMVDLLKAAGIRVVLISSTPLRNKYNLPLINYCTWMRDVAVEKKVPFLNIHREIVKIFRSGESEPLEFIPDRIHPSDGGYTKIGNIIGDFILSGPAR